jgi:ribosomal-protein-alanine N-acetyltransferase
MTAIGRVHPRWMIGRDMDQVLRIERESFDQAWTENDFFRALRQRSTLGMVCEHVGTLRILGFAVYSLTEDELLVINLAVDPECRRLGVGRAMIDKLKSKLAEPRRKALSITVRESNLPAQLFFKTQGFRWTETLGGFYWNGPEECREDGYVMSFKL